MDTMLLEYGEINSTIDKYLNDLESDDEKVLVPRQNKVQKNGIKTLTLNPKRVTFSKEPNGIYDTNTTLVVGALKDAKYFIYNGKKSNNNKIHSQ